MNPIEQGLFVSVISLLIALSLVCVLCIVLYVKLKGRKGPWQLECFGKYYNQRDSHCKVCTLQETCKFNTSRSTSLSVISPQDLQKFLDENFGEKK